MRRYSTLLLTAVAFLLLAPTDAMVRVPAAPNERTLEAISDSARVLPVHRDAELYAYQVDALKPESLFLRMGLRDGDRIIRVNGRSFGAGFTAADLFRLLQHAPSLNLAIESPEGSRRVLEVQFVTPAEA